MGVLAHIIFDPVMLTEFQQLAVMSKRCNSRKVTIASASGAKSCISWVTILFTSVGIVRAQGKPNPIHKSTTQIFGLCTGRT